METHPGTLTICPFQPPSISLRIHNIILPLNTSNTNDSIYWGLTNDGIFILKSAFPWWNSYFFKNSPLNPSQTAKIAIARVAKFWTSAYPSLDIYSLTVNLQHSHSIRPRNTNTWQPAPPPWLKLNYDGSSRNLLMGVGGCLRDATGK